MEVARIKTKNYKEHLLEQRQDPDEAAAYLNAALHDDDPHVFFLAFRDIADALKCDFICYDWY